MDFYQLSYFRKVAETGSVSRAAEKLFITQPAVSKRIKALEGELGERLFDRLGKKVFLTRAGEVLYSHAEKILSSVADAKAAVKDIAEECSGELVIGTSDHISLHRLPGLLKSYITTFPKVDLKLRCHRSETIIEMVGRNAVDLGIVTLPPLSENLVSKTVWADPMSLVFPRGHPLEKLPAVRLRDTASYAMILPESETTTRKTIDLAFSRKKLAPNVTMEVAYIETIKGLVMAGLGISVLPDKAVEQEVRDGVLISAETTDAVFTRNLGVVWLKGKFVSRPAREFLDLLDRETHNRR